MFADRLPVPGGIGLSEADNEATKRLWHRACEQSAGFERQAIEQRERAEKAEADLARLANEFATMKEIAYDLAHPSPARVDREFQRRTKAPLAGDGKGGVTATGPPAKPSAPAKPAKAEPCSYCGRFHCGYAQSTASPSRGA